MALDQLISPLVEEERKRRRRASSARWYRRNREKAQAAVLRWRKNHPGKERGYARKSRANNRIKENAYQRQRRMTSGSFRIAANLRRRVNKAIRGTDKSIRTLELLAMSMKEFRVYLQGQFRDGMGWENYGKTWHLDHIRPCASFDLTNPEQQRVCFRWDNIQPLLAIENMKKGIRYAR